MRFIRGQYNFLPEAAKTAVTIGNFDGVHLGHTALLQQMLNGAKLAGIASTVVLFEPQPQEFFNPGSTVTRLTRCSEKLEYLRKFGLSQVVCLPFDAKLANLTAQDFVKQVLCDGLNMRQLYIGDDFRFGRGKSGDFNLLQQLSSQYGFKLYQAVAVTKHNLRISSSRIRRALSAGDLNLVAELLGRNYTMLGRVVHGHKRGRKLGFPTANIYLHRDVSPLLGVYAVTVSGIGKAKYYGVANIGTRPTVDGTRTLLEVHLFNFAADIYGYKIEVEFISKLRDEQRFASLEILQRQIALDVAAGKRVFNLAQEIV
jgi:riboflavin kinase/FMN adenylyltransferase